jgi:hypothetical protein
MLLIPKFEYHIHLNNMISLIYPMPLLLWQNRIFFWLNANMTPNIIDLHSHLHLSRHFLKSSNHRTLLIYQNHLHILIHLPGSFGQNNCPPLLSLRGGADHALHDMHGTRAPPLSSVFSFFFSLMSYSTFVAALDLDPSCPTSTYAMTWPLVFGFGREPSMPCFGNLLLNPSLSPILLHNIAAQNPASLPLFLPLGLSRPCSAEHQSIEHLACTKSSTSPRAVRPPPLLSFRLRSHLTLIEPLAPPSVLSLSFPSAPKRRRPVRVRRCHANRTGRAFMHLALLLYLHSRVAGRAVSSSAQSPRRPHSVFLEPHGEPPSPPYLWLAAAPPFPACSSLNNAQGRCILI